MRAVKIAAFWLVSLTWGCIMTALGLIASLLLLCTGHRPYAFGYGYYFIVGKGWGGVNLGTVFIVSASAGLSTLQHEAGHGIQNIIFGILTPFIVGVPSMVRYWWRRWYVAKGYHITKKPLADYDAIWFEGQATRIGARLFPAK